MVAIYTALRNLISRKIMELEYCTNRFLSSALMNSLLLFNQDGKSKERRWTFHGVLGKLKTIRKEEAKIGDNKIIVKNVKTMLLKIVKKKIPESIQK